MAFNRKLSAGPAMELTRMKMIRKFRFKRLLVWFAAIFNLIPIVVFWACIGVGEDAAISQVPIWAGDEIRCPAVFTAFPRHVTFILIPLLLFLTAALLWLWFLRRQVARRTAALRKSEEQYRLLADNTLDVIWTLNLNFEFTYINQACLQLTGHTPEELIGRRLADLCDEENFTKMTRIAADEMANGPAGAGFFAEAVILNKNREPVPVEIRGRVIYADTGRPLRLQGSVRNIAERKQAETVLRYQHLLLQEMGQIAKIGGWEFDPASGKGTWTDETARIHDVDPQAVASLERGLNFFHGPSRAKINEAIKAAVELGTPYDLELELVTAKGVHKWVRTIGKPKMENGKVIQVRGSFQDITSQKLSEQRIEHLNRVLRAIRDVNQLIMHERNPDTLIREGCRLLVDHRGYASALIILTDETDLPVSWATAGIAASSGFINTLLERGDLPFCCAPDRPGMEIEFSRVMHGGCGKCPIAEGYPKMHSLGVPLIHEGRPFGYLVAALDSDLKVDDEEIRLLVDMAGDLAFALQILQLDKEHRASEQKREVLEGQLIQAQKMEAVGQLAGGVAHDYNNMLSVIIGFTEEAMDKVNPNEPLRADLIEILKAAKRSADITRQLLAFARQQTIAPKVLDLNETVEGMLNMLRRLIGEDIELVWRPRTPLWPVKIDPAQVDQIMANLCVNARDAIDGVGNITIETENVRFNEADCVDHPGFFPGEHVRLSVSDDGIGMTAETLSKVFEPFFTTKEVGRGTGLGLATVYGIIKQNNGFIDIFSKPGKGTTLKIYLPRQTGRTSAVSSNGQGNLPLGKGETLLIVEDEISMLKLGRKILESLGYQVLFANTPGEAVGLAEKHLNDIRLLITDVVMPEMNGRDLANHLRGFVPGLKTLFMSGHTADVIAHRGVLKKGVCFIQKPFSKKELAVKVREALDEKKPEE